MGETGLPSSTASASRRPPRHTDCSALIGSTEQLEKDGGSVGQRRAVTGQLLCTAAPWVAHASEQDGALRCTGLPSVSPLCSLQQHTLAHPTVVMCGLTRWSAPPEASRAWCSQLTMRPSPRAAAELWPGGWNSQPPSAAPRQWPLRRAAPAGTCGWANRGQGRDEWAHS